MKMVLSTHSLLMALGEILICFLAISPATGKAEQSWTWIVANS